MSLPAIKPTRVHRDASVIANEDQPRTVIDLIGGVLFIDDARALQLVLIGGKTGAEVEGHDWERILETLGWLHLDHTLARAAHFTGAVIMLFALAWAFTLVVRQWQRQRGGEGLTADSNEV
jgi:hypothetical protein